MSEGFTPKTIAVTIKEGGPWLRWQEGSGPHFVHSIAFEDGTIWDAINGWRHEIMPLEELRKLKRE